MKLPLYISIVLIDIRSGVNSVMIDSHLDGVNLPRNHEICVTVIVFKIIPIPTDHLFIQIVHPLIHPSTHPPIHPLKLRLTIFFRTLSSPKMLFGSTNQICFYPVYTMPTCYRKLSLLRVKLHNYLNEGPTQVS